MALFLSSWDAGSIPSPSQVFVEGICQEHLKVRWHLSCVTCTNTCTLQGACLCSPGLPNAFLAQHIPRASCTSNPGSSQL